MTIHHHIRKNKIVYFIVTAIFIAVLIGGAYFFQQSSINEAVLGREFTYLKYKFEVAQSNDHNFFVSLKEVFGSLWTSPSSSLVPDSGQLVPILFYSNIVNQAPTLSSEVSLNNFQAQLDALQTAGYKTITLDQFQKFTSSGAAIPNKSVLLVFGNDSENQYNLLDPLLKTFDDHGVMVVSTENSSSSFYLSSNDLQEMTKSGGWDVVTATSFRYITLGKAFTQNGIGKNEAKGEVEAQSTWTTNGENTVMTGQPNIAALNSFDLHISDQGSVPLTVWLGGVSAVAEPAQATLTIIFDNGWSSEYSLAMPTLAKYGFPAVITRNPGNCK